MPLGSEIVRFSGFNFCPSAELALIDLLDSLDHELEFMGRQPIESQNSPTQIRMTDSAAAMNRCYGNLLQARNRLAREMDQGEI